MFVNSRLWANIIWKCSLKTNRPSVISPAKNGLIWDQQRIVVWVCNKGELSQPQIGTCHGCLPSTFTRIKSCAAIAADLQYPLKEFRVERSNEAFCAPGNWKDSFQIVRYSQKLILLVHFFYLLISRKALKSFMVTIVSHDLQKLHETSRNFLPKKKKCLLACNPPLPGSHIYCLFPLPLWNSLSDLPEVLSPILQASYGLK